MVAAGITAAAAAASAGSSIASAASGPPSAPSYGGNPTTYVPTAQPGADADYQNLVMNQMYGQAQGMPGYLWPQFQSTVGQITSNPYASTAQTGANAAASATPAVTGYQLGGAQSLYGAGTSALPFASQILQQGFDPQRSLYNQDYQQAMDQSNAINAMNGVGGTPYGAGLTNQAAQNFNTQWNANLLNNEATAAQGYGSMIQGAGNALTGASTLGTGALSNLVSGYSAPYATSYGQEANDLSALQALTNASSGVYALPQQTIQDLQSYLQLGQSASGQALLGQGQLFNQQQQLGSNLANSLANPGLSQALNNIFGSSSSSSLGYDPYSYTSNPSYAAEMTTLPDAGSAWGSFGY